MWLSLKAHKIESPREPEIPQKNGQRGLQEILHILAHDSGVPTKQTVEAAQCPPADEPRTKRGASSKRTEILTRATTWMKLVDNLPTEISQSQKNEYCRISPL